MHVCIHIYIHTYTHIHLVNFISPQLGLRQVAEPVPPLDDVVRHVVSYIYIYIYIYIYYIYIYTYIYIHIYILLTSSHRNSASDRWHSQCLLLMT